MFISKFRHPITSTSKLFWIVFTCYLWLCISADLIASKAAQNVTRQRQSQSTCIKPQFTCASRDCIEVSKLCNGVKDCKDGSDETVKACKQVKCPDSFFRCDYGGCIRATLKCNGRRDCADNSDEAIIRCSTNSSNSQDLILFRKCKTHEWRCRLSGKCILQEGKCNGKTDCDDGSDETIQTCQSSVRVDEKSAMPPSQTTKQSTIIRPTTIAPASTDCDIPHDSEITVVLTDSNDSWLNTSLLSKAPKFSKIQIFCNPDYAMSNGDKFQRAVCLQKVKWSPPLRACLKTCPNLQSENMILSCHRGGAEIDCEGELVNGTTIRSRCRPLYHLENEVLRELQCLESGQWDRALSECVPDCGITNTLLQETQNLIIEGKLTNASDSPWHVAIYRFSDGTSESPILICGGTLISASIVVSAAHCFFDFGQGVTLANQADYEVVVSKYTRNYTIVDNTFQRRYKIRDIIFTDAGYNPTLTGQFSNDIVALVLKRKVEMNKFVLPACIDWIGSGVNGSRLAEGTPGKLVGWGVDKEANVDGSPILLYADLPYISFQKCVGKLKQIDTDKFCAGNQTGAGARKGDSGGGLMFRNSDSGRYYLRGIVSTTDKDGKTSVATFTDVSKYIDWLDRVRARVKKDLKNAATDSIGVCNITYGPGQKIELFDDKDNWLNIPLGMKAPKLTTIEITCNPQYTLGNENRFQRSTCFLKENWSPPLKACLNWGWPTPLRHKRVVDEVPSHFRTVYMCTFPNVSSVIKEVSVSEMCPNLHPANMDLSCYLKGEKIDCNGKLVSGTRIRPSCKTFYHSDRKVGYRELRCHENGEWDNEIFECVLDCGFLPPSEQVHSQLKKNITVFPWNVAIYRREDGSLPTLQCSGTLISSNMIVSAANCFYDHNQGVILNSPQDYEIVVSKFTKDYSTIDNIHQKQYEINDIMFTTGDDLYDPYFVGHSSNNIVVLVTKETVQMSEFVLPACTDWTNPNYDPSLHSEGELVGWLWGPNTTQNLEYINFFSMTSDSCSVTSFIDEDKICMESAERIIFGLDNITTIETRYSGEGLVFLNFENRRYFLRGISGRKTVKTFQEDVVIAFTDVSKHVRWLKGIYDSMREDEIISKGCQIPNDGFDMEWNEKVELRDENDNPLNTSSGLKAPKFSKIKITCGSNYSLQDGEKIQQSVCVYREEWNPPLRPCLKMCPTLNSANMNFSCYRNGMEVDCNGEMIYGTRVRPECAPYFKRERLGAIYRELSCRANGIWDQELFKCVPDCGIPRIQSANSPSTTTWSRTDASAYPWNVAMYQRNFDSSSKFLCSGTLISFKLVVSVAHWFYDSKRSVPMNATDYEAHIDGHMPYTKYYNYKTHKSYLQKNVISEIIFTDIRYNPTSVRLNDIVVLVLETPIQMNEIAFPACVDWNSKMSGFRLVEGTLGNLVASLKTTNVSAQIPHHTQLTFISSVQCYKKLGYFDPDRFCAGSDNGSTIQSGIGGGGLVFRDPNNERYFLRGVWSGKSSNNKVNVGTFTDISKHIDWLGRVRERVERESTAAEQTSNVVIVEANEWLDSH